ncbi:MAG: TetR/AcrR family transcriptional regulator [Chryseobacterium sp.]
METKEKILLTSYQIFINKGFHNTSMQQLVEASGFSKGAFYHYFKNKNDLYENVINRYFLQFYRSVNWDVYFEAKMTVKEIEENIQAFYLDFVPQILSLNQNGMSAYFIMYFEAFTLLPNFKNEVKKFYDNLEYLIVNASDNTEKLRKTAVDIIAKYEGLLFLLALNPDADINSFF